MITLAADLPASCSLCPVCGGCPASHHTDEEYPVHCRHAIVVYRRICCRPLSCTTLKPFEFFQNLSSKFGDKINYRRWPPYLCDNLPSKFCDNLLPNFATKIFRWQSITELPLNSIWCKCFFNTFCHRILPFCDWKFDWQRGFALVAKTLLFLKQK